MGPKKESEVFGGKYRGLAGPVTSSPQCITISSELTRPHILNISFYFVSLRKGEGKTQRKQAICLIVNVRYKTALSLRCCKR